MYLVKDKTEVQEYLEIVNSMLIRQYFYDCSNIGCNCEVYVMRI